jgi:hypothetical protein
MHVRLTGRNWRDELLLVHEFTVPVGLVGAAG